MSLSGPEKNFAAWTQMRHADVLPLPPLSASAPNLQDAMSLLIVVTWNPQILKVAR